MNYLFNRYRPQYMTTLQEKTLIFYSTFQKITQTSAQKVLRVQHKEEIKSLKSNNVITQTHAVLYLYLLFLDRHNYLRFFLVTVFCGVGVHVHVRVRCVCMCSACAHSVRAHVCCLLATHSKQVNEQLVCQKNLSISNINSKLLGCKGNGHNNKKSMKFYNCSSK